MSNFKIVIPQATTNQSINPSFETGTTDWTTGGTNALAQSATVSKYGLYSLRVTYQDNAILAQETVTLVGSAKTFKLTAWVYPSSTWNAATVYISTVNFTSATTTTVTAWSALTDATGKWYRLETTLEIAADYSGTIRISSTGFPTAGRLLYIDGVQFEESADATTYCDGTQRGCYWLGAPHASASRRGALEPLGGVLKDFSDDLGLVVSRYAGMGMPAIANHSSPNALLPGATHTGAKMQRRMISLGAHIEGSTLADLHDTRQAITQAFNTATVPAASRNAPRLFQYAGATEVKEFTAVYDSGLEGFIEEAGFNEPQATIKLLADDPLFYQVGESTAVIDTRDGATMRMVAGRLDGLWDMLGAPTETLGSPIIYRMIPGPDGKIYVGGHFTNFGGFASADYLTVYDPYADVWAAVGAGIGGLATINVIALAFDASGNLYVGGDFINVGDANGDYILMWDGSSWNSLGGGLDGTVNDILVHTDGNVYIAGDFTTENGGTAMAGIGYWDGSSWNAMGAGLTGGISPAGHALARALNGNVYVAGNFTTAGGVACANIAEWDGSAFSPLAGGLGSATYALATTPDGQLYAGGTFTTADSFTANRVARWSGTGWYPTGSGFNATCSRLVAMADGTIWAGGSFTTADGIGTTGIALWNGSIWARPGITLPTGWSHVRGLCELNGNIYVGCEAYSATAYYAGDTTITYGGTAPARPWITINRSGGTLATVRKITNTLTGAELFLNYQLADGETLTIDLRPGSVSVTSSLFGNQWGAILPNSDVAQFAIMPGNVTGDNANIIAAYVYTTGSPTITTVMYYRNTYLGAD